VIRVTTGNHYLLAERRDQIRNLVEVGIGTNSIDVPCNMGTSGIPGASLRGWRSYLPEANIHGADIDQRILFTEPRIVTFFVNQLSAESIRELWQKLGAVDLFIDDGLHTFEANSTLLTNSFDCLAEGGIYVIEDIILERNNLAKFASFFESFGLNGFMTHLPSRANSYDNCIACFQR